MMEAARILKALNVQPRRTIRIALWSGEEQGLLGSQAYVKAALRIRRSADAGVREVQRLPEHRHRHRPAARRVGVRPARNRRGPARDPRAVQGPEGRRRVPPPRAARPAAPTARRSTTPGCRASASTRTRSSTAATRTTPTSTPTSASSSRTFATPPSSSPARSISSRCATQPLPRFAPDKMPPKPAPRGGGGQ